MVTLPAVETESVALHCLGCRTVLSRHDGSYRCGACGAGYPMVDGILRMVPELSRPERLTQDAFDFEHRRFQSAQYLRISPELCGAWLRDVQLPAEYFQSKTVLDVGCGSGRWTYAMASLGAKVFAVDLSSAAVEVTRQVTRGVGDVTVIQTSLFQLPFKPEQFDFVVSWGVLHHTRSTVQAFRSIAPLVRPGGQLYVMVYERRSPLKVVGTELLRMALRRLSPEARYRFCGKLVIGNPVLFQLLRGLIACIPEQDLSPSLDRETAQFGLYDWYSPRFNHLHSVTQVRGWFEEAGFGDLRLTTPVKYRRPLEVLRFGECGGSISLRGERVTGRRHEAVR